MKRVIFTLVAACIFSLIPGFSKDGGDRSKEATSSDEGKFLVMSGYGYAYSSDIGSGGFGSSESILYCPNRHWGFGIDLGYSYTNGSEVDPVYGHSNAFEQDHHHNYFYFGPSAYWFPVNSEKHLVYIGAGVNYSHARDIELLTSYEPSDNSTYDYFQRPVSNGVGIVANAGYTFMFNDHIGIGPRCWFSWFEQAHVYGLVNVSFKF